ncbi:hypothetical protein Gogos_000121 [Gossypium gossypioides]|uniref:Uncharacterized protein n=1 Tax=Gossypium gossypioides TaxID=34282 RepID=A0A7J9D6Y0_GOSGO|nr:hypothetical protein [Gossypium gossypioides]
MKRLAVVPTMTPEYIEWWGRRINDNIPGPSQGDNQPTGKHLRVVPSELEIIRQDFEKKKFRVRKEDRTNGRGEDELEIKHGCSEARN